MKWIDICSCPVNPDVIRLGAWLLMMKFHFSIRSLLVVVTLFCVVLATALLRAKNQRAAMRAIDRLGGVAFSTDDIALQKPLAWHCLNSVRSVWIPCAEMKTEHEQIIALIPCLKQLVITNGHLCDDAELVEYQSRFSHIKVDCLRFRDYVH